MDRTAVKKQKSASAPKKKKTPKTKKTPKKKKTPVKKKTAESSSSSNSSTMCGQKPERLAQHRRSLDGPVVYLLKLM